MTTYVALLRAVNVGGRNRLSMSALREVLTGAGLDRVATVLQSGNVVFSSSRSERKAAGTVHAAIEHELGLDVGVVVRSAGQLTAIAKSNPFLAEAPDADPGSLHVAFLATRPAAGSADRLDPDRSPPDAFLVSGREVFLSYPGGSGNSRLTLTYLEKQLGTVGTARTWRTVLRLADAVADR